MAKDFAIVLPRQIHSKEGMQPGVALQPYMTMTKVFLLQGLLLLLPGETFCLPVQSLLLNYKPLCSWEKELLVTVPQSLCKLGNAEQPFFSNCRYCL